MEKKDLLELTARLSSKILQLESRLHREERDSEFWYEEFNKCEKEKVAAQDKCDCLQEELEMLKKRGSVSYGEAAAGQA